MTEPPKKFQDAVAERRRLKAESQKPVETFADDLIPDEGYQKTPGDLALDTVVNGIKIVDAYTRWCGKSKVRIRPGQVESIKLACPNPLHTDKEPSYSINTDKNTGKCFVCGVGYDSHDIAAFALGYPVPEYKKGADFRKLRIEMAEAFGFIVSRSLAGEVTVIPPREPNSGKTDTEDSPASSEEASKNYDDSDIADISGVRATSSERDRADDNVEELYADEPNFEIAMPTLDWQSVAPSNDSFIDAYMAATCGDEAPEEYHFFNALLAVSFAGGREVTLQSKMPVYPNLFICSLGKSGTGKSTANRHLKLLLKKCLPYDPNDPNSKGVEHVTPASAESLIKAFSKPVYDPTDPKRIVYHASVKGLIDYNELSGLIGRASRSGNILKPVMMDFYDMNTDVRTQSNTGGKIIAENPFACCSTTTQPGVLRDLIRSTDDASGFLNRWLFIGGVPKKSTIMGTGKVDLDHAAEKLDEIKGWTASFKAGEQVTWSQESLEYMQKFFDEQIYPLKARDESNIFVRFDLLFLKLTLLLSINKMEKVVTLDTVFHATSMLTYLKLCFGIPAEQMGNSLEHEMTEAIVFQMRRLGKKEGCTLNALALALKRRKYPKDLILKNLKALIELGFVEERSSSDGSRGRPTKKYCYVA